MFKFNRIAILLLWNNKDLDCSLKLVSFEVIDQFITRKQNRFTPSKSDIRITIQRSFVRNKSTKKYCESIFCSQFADVTREDYHLKKY